MNDAETRFFFANHKSTGAYHLDYRSVSSGRGEEGSELVKINLVGYDFRSITLIAVRRMGKVDKLPGIPDAMTVLVISRCTCES